MSSELRCLIRFDTNISDLYSQLRGHCLVHDPPYNIHTMIREHLGFNGRPVTIIIEHRTRNINVVEDDIRHHVLQTAVSGFQNHRFGMPSSGASPWSVEQFSAGRRLREEPSVSIPNRNSGKSCSICLGSIMTNDLQYLPCAHVFHRNCIGKWFQRSMTCPVCRSVV
jgi:hypothetical protein